MKKHVFWVYLLATNGSVLGMNYLECLKERYQNQWKRLFIDLIDEERIHREKQIKQFLNSATIEIKEKRESKTFFAIEKNKPLFCITNEIEEVIEYYKSNSEHLELCTCSDKRFPDVYFTPLQLMILNGKIGAYRIVSGDTLLLKAPYSEDFVLALMQTKASDFILKKLLNKAIIDDKSALPFFINAFKNNIFINLIFDKINDKSLLVTNNAILKELVKDGSYNDLIIEYYIQNTKELEKNLYDSGKCNILDLSLELKNKSLVRQLFSLGGLPSNQKTIQLFLLFYIDYTSLNVKEYKKVKNLILTKNVLTSGLGVTNLCHCKGLLEAAFFKNHNLAYFIYTLLCKGDLPEEFLTHKNLKKIKKIYEHKNSIKCEVPFDKEFVKNNLYFKKNNE